MRAASTPRPAESLKRVAARRPLPHSPARPDLRFSMSKVPIRAVFFDLGNVLVNLEMERAARRLAAVTGRSEVEVVLLVTTIAHEAGYELGKTTSRNFVRLVSERCGTLLEFEKFAAAWNDMFSENTPMIELARSLRGVLPRFILSNTNELHIDFIGQQFPFFNEFDGYILSYRDHVAKPGLEIYRLALARAGAEAELSLFIDDREDNVLGARQAGMNAVHYADKPHAMKEIKQWLRLD